MNRHGGDIYRNRIDIDFSVNLNPLGTPSSVMDALKSALKRVECYPDPFQEDVRRKLADLHGLDRENVYAGCGASELIQAAIRAINPKRALLFEPGFSGYRYALESVGCVMTHHPLSEGNGFAPAKEDIRAISTDIDIVFVCDPLSPSGINIDDELIDCILDEAKNNKAAVILDESFYEMSDKAAAAAANRSRELIMKYDNLFIIRSLTKLLAIPGIRAGYAISSCANIRRMIRQLPEWNLPVTSEEAIKAGIRAISETGLVQETVRLIRKERDYLSGILKGYGFKVIDSNTSYILFRGPDDLYDKLLGRGILIRDCSDYEGLEKGWYRTAVKDHMCNEKFAEALREIMNEN